MMTGPMKSRKCSSSFLFIVYENGKEEFRIEIKAFEGREWRRLTP